ncbi:hypothetical protein diail_1209 [Diaporthe ilicicola]|nr:hypothetical protein diail_1209 [Diaporthe ilicicola]
MLLRPLLAVAGLSAATHAILLPPDISSHDAEVIETLPFESAALAQTQSLSLDCPGCPPMFKNHHGKQKHHKQHTSHLELDFSVDRSAGSDRLMLNGFELYPNSDPFTNLLVAPQVADKPKHHKDHKKHDKHLKGEEKHDGDNSRVLPSHHKFRPGHQGRPKVVEQPLGFGLQIHPVQKTADDNLDLVVLDLQIIEVGSVFVEGLPNIRVNMIKSPQDDLMIAKIEQLASENVSSPKGDDTCTTTLCKLKAIIADKLNKMKMHGCAGMMGSKAGHGHGHPSSHHEEHYGMFNRPNGWSLFFRKVTSHIILPVLVGIVAGVTVAVVSMLVGTVLVGMFRKFVRGQSFFPQRRCRLHPGGRHHKSARMEAAVDEEKSGLMENQEGLPPSYDQVEVDHVERA